METGEKFVWKGHDKEKMQKRVVQLCTLRKTLSKIGFLSGNWALPGKRWELSTYIRFWKKTTEISRFVISPLEILVKTKLFILKKSCKTIWHILGMKPKSLWFFLYCPWRLLLLRDNPGKFHIVFLQYFRKTQVLE